MARFFIAGTNFPNGRAIIRGRDADHIRVLRLRAGDDIVICDGAERASVRLAITQAVSSLTGLGSNKIAVVKMKGQ